MWDNLCNGNLFKKEDTMNSNQNFNNLGDQFKYAVQDAINKGDFSKLNFLVTDTVTDVIAEAQIQVKKATHEIQKEFNSNSHSEIYKNVQEYQNKQHQRNQQFQHTMQNVIPTPLKMMPVSKTKNVGQISSILYMVFGGIGTCFMGFSLVISILGMLLSGELLPGMLFFLGLSTGGFGFVLKTGVNQHQRLSRMKRYISLCDDNMYININELAQHTHKTVDYVLKDLKKMLTLGFFPQGHLDQKETCLMLDDATYREYLRVEKERKILAEEEAKKATATPEEKALDELNAIVAEGQDYIQKLHYLNDLIEDEVVSEKLYRMESLLKEIFARLKEDPEQMPKTRKLMNYYLPTTIKLLQAYSEFDDVSAPNQDIASAKAEIEKTIDIINEAFTELLNKLFQKSAFDAATDAQVLQTMLAQEGLTKNSLTEEI